MKIKFEAKNKNNKTAKKFTMFDMKNELDLRDDVNNGLYTRL